MLGLRFVFDAFEGDMFVLYMLNLFHILASAVISELSIFLG